MTRMVKFPHIEQFKNVIRQVSNAAQWVGRDENGDPIFDRNILLPKLKFTGTTKLHGTNASVGCLSDGTLWAQSRENIITPEKDNAGFATFVYANRERFSEIFSQVEYDESQFDGLVLYGEWVGNGIQKGVAVSQLPKMFVVFGAKLISNNLEEYGNVWVEKEVLNRIIPHDPVSRIFNITTFGEWEIEIDFNRPELSTNKLIELTEQVEHCCPVGKFFGIHDVGEGIVWKCETEPYIGGKYMFKVKGERHVKHMIVQGLIVPDRYRAQIIRECEKLDKFDGTFEFI